MITPVWGDYYIKRWFDLCVASLRAEDNFSYLNEHCDFELAIVTKEAEIGRLRADPRFVGALAGIKTRFVTLDEFFPPNGRTDYGVPLTLAYAKGILDLGDSAIGTYVILLNADFVLTPGSMKSIVQRMHDGYGVILGTSIRTIEAPMRAWLHERVDPRTGILSVPPRTMMQAIFANLHNHARARIINEPNIVETAYYNQIYWRISEDCLAMRGLLLTPFCFRVDRIMDKVLCPVDYGFITEFCPDGRFCAMTDSDAFLMVELQEPHSESYLLRVAPTFPSEQARLAWLASDIVTNVGTWATSEQRRSCTETLYYHAKDLPDDLQARVAPFKAFVDDILERLPQPPISHISHWHWLPAVRIYNEDMIRGGAPGRIPLIDDPRNDVVEKIPPSHFLKPQPERPASVGGPAAGHRARIAGMVARRLKGLNADGVDVLYIGDSEAYAPAPPSGVRVGRVADPSGPDNRTDFNVALPEALEGRDGERALVVYAGIGVFVVWERMEHDLDAFLRHREGAVLAFIRQGFEPLPFATHTHILSLLIKYFPVRKFSTSLDVYDPAASGGFGAVAALRRAWKALAQCVRTARPAQPDAPPAGFSALVVTVRRRPAR